MSKQRNEKSAFATAALIVGIIGVILSFVPIINNLAFVMGGLGLILAVIALVQRRSIAVAVVSIVLAIAAMGITLAMQKSVSDALDEAGKEMNKSMDDMSGKNTEDVLKNDVQVDVGEFTVSADEYGIESSNLPVTIKNKTNEKKSFTVKIEAVNSEGARIEDDTVYANDLGAGQEQNIDTFKFVQSDKYDALKQATFKVVSASKM